MTAQLEKEHHAAPGGRLGWNEGPSSEPEKERNTFVNLAALVAIVFALSRIFDVGGPVLVVIAILAMVMMHEFGHFITARMAGMKVTDFFVGFGPTLWSIKVGETRYGVKGLPFGGFVRVIGMNSLEEVDPAEEHRTYRAKSYFQRVRFAAAGSFSHFVLAFLLMVVLLWGYGATDPERSTTVVDRVSAELPNGETSPAVAAGLEVGDKIVGINGAPVDDWADVVRTVHASANRPVAVTIDRDGRRFTKTITPADARSPEDVRSGLKPTGMIGISSAPYVEKFGLPRAAWEAGFRLKTLTVDSTKAIYGIFHPEGVKSVGQQMSKSGPADPATESENRLLSPIGMFRVADVSVENGFDAVLNLLIGINVFVGIFNMIPLPPFDGGHIAVATYEAVMSKRKGRRHMIDMAKMLPVAYVVVIGMFLMTASALYLDIMRPFDFG